MKIPRKWASKKKKLISNETTSANVKARFLPICASRAFTFECAEKPRPWRVQRWVKLHFLTFWGRAHHFWRDRDGKTLEVSFTEESVRQISTHFWFVFEVTRSAPHDWNSKFDPPLDAPGSGLSSVPWINSTRWKLLQKSAHFSLWETDENFTAKSSVMVTCCFIRLLCHFRGNETGPKVEEFYGCPTVECARVGALQRTFK